MPVRIKIDNFDDGNIISTDIISVDSAAGDTTVKVPNSRTFVNQQLVIIGAIGTDSSEIATVQSTPDAGTVQFAAALKFKHELGDAITLIYGDTLNLWRAPNVDGHFPADASYTVLTPPSPTTISYEEAITYLVDPNGSNAYWYKFTYLNSITGAQTNIDDSTAARGDGFDYYCTIEDIRKTAGFLNNPWITDADIDAKRLEAQAEIDAALQGMYAVPFQPPLDPMIVGITRLLAAGKLMDDEYGPGGGTASAEGANKMAEAQSMLDLIDARKYILTDVTGISLISPNSQSSKSFPDSNTSLDSTDPLHGGSDRIFRMSDVGRGTRRY